MIGIYDYIMVSLLIISFLPSTSSSHPLFSHYPSWCSTSRHCWTTLSGRWLMTVGWLRGRLRFLLERCSRWRCGRPCWHPWGSGRWLSSGATPLWVHPKFTNTYCTHTHTPRHYGSKRGPNEPSWWKRESFCLSLWCTLINLRWPPTHSLLINRNRAILLCKF